MALKPRSKWIGKYEDITTMLAGLFLTASILAPQGLAAEVHKKADSIQSTPLEEAPPQLPNVDKLLGIPEPVEVSADQSSKSSTAPPDAANTEPKQTAMVITRPVAQSAPVKPAPLAQVKQHYNQGKFKDALSMLSTMRSTEITHYWAGLCYQGQGQLKQAAQEFQFVASYGRDPMVKYNAQQALRAVSTYARNRTYKGQGNNFAKAAGPAPVRVRRG